MSTFTDSSNAPMISTIRQGNIPGFRGYHQALTRSARNGVQEGFRGGNGSFYENSRPLIPPSGEADSYQFDTTFQDRRNRQINEYGQFMKNTQRAVDAQAFKEQLQRYRQRTPTTGRVLSSDEYLRMDPAELSEGISTGKIARPSATRPGVSASNAAVAVTRNSQVPSPNW